MSSVASSEEGCQADLIQEPHNLHPFSRFLFTLEGEN